MIRWKTFPLFVLLALPLAGQDAFQQETAYTIAVALDDERHELNGEIELSYRNASPTTLDTLWLHLWPNAYKNRFSRLCAQKLRNNDFGLYFAREQAKGSIDSLDFRSDDKALTWGYHREFIDVAYVIPHAPLAPASAP